VTDPPPRRQEESLHAHDAIRLVRSGRWLQHRPSSARHAGTAIDPFDQCASNAPVVLRTKRSNARRAVSGVVHSGSYTVKRRGAAPQPTEGRGRVSACNELLGPNSWVEGREGRRASSPALPLFYNHEHTSRASFKERARLPNSSAYPRPTGPPVEVTVRRGSLPSDRFSTRWQA
jgi:hypothetical protein